MIATDELRHWLEAYKRGAVYHKEGQRPGGFFYRTNSTDSLALLDGLYGLLAALKASEQEWKRVLAIVDELHAEASRWAYLDGDYKPGEEPEAGIARSRAEWVVEKSAAALSPTTPEEKK